MTQLPAGWADATLSDVAELVRGVTYKKSESRALPGAGLVPIVRATNIDGRLRTDTELVYVPESAVSPSQRLRVGDVVVASSSGSASVVGKSAIVRTEWDGGFGAFCTVLRARPGIVARYLGHYVASPSIRQRWSDLASGTNINNLKRAHFQETAVPIPPLAEQRRIVAAIEEQLSRLDAAATSVRSALARTPRLRDAVFERAFRHDWPLRPLGEMLREPLRNGLSARASTTGTTRIITLSAVTLDAFTDRNSKLADVDDARARDLWLEPGDVVIERSNTPELVGTAALYAGPPNWAIFPDLLIRVRCTDAIRPDYLALVLRTRSVRRYFQLAAEGLSGSMPKIDQEDIRRLPVPVPPLAEQAAVVAEVSRELSLVRALESAAGSAVQGAGSLRQSILARAFRGELVPQDPDDEPASVLLERIAAERAAAPRPARRRHGRVPAGR